MQHLHANFSVSVTELKKNPSALVQEAKGEPVAIMNHNIPMAYLIPAQTYEAIMNHLDEQALTAIIDARKTEKAFKVDIDEL